MMCLTPWYVKEKHEESKPVPCGKCPPCRKRHASAWSFRLVQEDKTSTNSHFVTLTYDTDFVHITKSNFLTLNKKDVQRFIKSIRKRNPDRKIKYYAVGEYGGETRRPHYHIILYNAEEHTIQAAWHKGAVHVGYVAGASVGYTLKYLSKPKTVPIHQNDDRLPEFSLISKGIGRGYLTKERIKWHQQDPGSRRYVTTIDGHKAALPRYYQQQIWPEGSEQREQLEESNAELIQRARQKLAAAEGDHRILKNKEMRDKWRAKDYYRNLDEAKKMAFINQSKKDLKGKL